MINPLIAAQVENRRAIIGAKQRLFYYQEINIGLTYLLIKKCPPFDGSF
jgi:hypothetical protein